MSVFHCNFFIIERHQLLLKTPLHELITTFITIKIRSLQHSTHQIMKETY